MKKINKQTQSSGDHSTSVQAETINFTQGLNYLEVKEAALDVFNANFQKLAGEAASVAVSRAEEVTDKFLKKLQERNPSGLKNAKDPDFQHSLYTVQKEHARIGDEVLADLLVDILVDRSKFSSRDIMQIVLNESLSVAPKLTHGQICALTVVFVLTRTQNRLVLDHSRLGQYLETYIKPSFAEMSTSRASFEHLQFTGCGSIQMLGGSSLSNVIAENYHGLFMNGFTTDQLESEEIRRELKDELVISCLNDDSKFQINAINKEGLDKKMEELGAQPEEIKKIEKLFKLNKMGEVHVKNKITEIWPSYSDLSDTWANTPLGNFNLTSVGIAIGHANIQRVLGRFADLKIWIN